MAKVYIISVRNLDCSNPTMKISQEAYATIDKAQYFCKNRSDKPEQVSGYLWKSEKHEYVILDLDLVE